MKQLAFTLFLFLAAFNAGAQAMYFSSATVQEVDTTPAFNPADTITVDPIPVQYFMPAIFNHYEFYDPSIIQIPDTAKTAFFPKPGSSCPFKASDTPDWLRRADNTARLANQLTYVLLYNSPELVRHSRANMPDPPKMTYTVIDPSTLRFDIRQFEADPMADAEIKGVNLRKRHWINSFAASLQFSQAYVSPNWYQGGNSNLTAIAQLNWDLKLNQKYHPNLLFEVHAQYKLGTNSAPDDSLHSYNISEDLLQINSTFGVKAAKRWYYSLTAQFKTQLLNSYVSNSNTTRAAFLSPGELNIGLGMTYNYANEKSTVTFDASVSPLTYNLRTCISDKVNSTAYDIPEGRTTKSKFGSSAECRFKWKLSHNITFKSRLFAFSDYDRFEFDWENTLVFEINRFLTTQIYAHARYDTSTQPCDDPSWHKLQVKEILSIGFAYKFANS